MVISRVNSVGVVSFRKIPMESPDSFWFRGRVVDSVNETVFWLSNEFNPDLGLNKLKMGSISNMYLVHKNCFHHGVDNLN